MRRFPVPFLVQGTPQLEERRMHITFRIDKQTPPERIAQIEANVRRAFENYTASEPLSIPCRPQCLIEAFPSERPYTPEGDVMGLTDLVRSHWWSVAITMVMEAIRKEFPGHGVVFYTRGADHYMLGQEDEQAA